VCLVSRLFCLFPNLGNLLLDLLTLLRVPSSFMKGDLGFQLLHLLGVLPVKEEMERDEYRNANDEENLMQWRVEIARNAQQDTHRTQDRSLQTLSFVLPTNLLAQLDLIVCLGLFPSHDC
jgi:hypothetical protein